MPTLTTAFPMGETLTNYFVERAKGGAGWIFVGICGIEKGLNYTIDVSSDTTIPSLRNLARAIKAKGAKAAIQVWHPVGD